MWQFVSSGTKRTAFLEEQWTLEKLQWKEIPQPPRSSEPATWQLIEKLEAAKNDPVPMLLRREVPEPQKFLANSLDGVFGLFLELKGDRVFNRFVRDEGVHRFHFPNRKPDVHVFTGLPTIDLYLPPFGIERRGAVVLADRCRDYEYTRSRMTDAFLAEWTELLEGNLPYDLGPFLARRHMKVAEWICEQGKPKKLPMPTYRCPVLIWKNAAGIYTASLVEQHERAAVGTSVKDVLEQLRSLLHWQYREEPWRDPPDLKAPDLIQFKVPVRPEYQDQMNSRRFPIAQPIEMRVYCVVGRQSGGPRMIRLDMSEYAGPWAADRLLMQSNGEPSDFLQQIRRQPFTVLLLDEIEKANPSVYDVLMNVFDEGRKLKACYAGSWSTVTVVAINNDKTLSCKWDCYPALTSRRTREDLTVARQNSDSMFGPGQSSVDADACPDFCRKSFAFLEQHIEDRYSFGIREGTRNCCSRTS